MKSGARWGEFLDYVIFWNLRRLPKKKKIVKSLSHIRMPFSLFQNRKDKTLNLPKTRKLVYYELLKLFSLQRRVTTY